MSDIWERIPHGALPFKEYIARMEAAEENFEEFDIPPAPQARDEEMFVDGQQVERLDESYLKEFEQELLMYIRMAMGKSRAAVQWRDFKVGCIALARTTEKAHLTEPERFLLSRGGKQVDNSVLPDNDSFGVYDGANVKLDGKPQDPDKKRCAERITFIDIQDKDAKPVIGMVVASEKLQKDSRSDIESPTLHPCKECRDMFAQQMQTGVLRPDSQIVLVNFESSVDNDVRTYKVKAVERFTLSQLLELHNRTDKKRSYGNA